VPDRLCFPPAPFTPPPPCTVCTPGGTIVHTRQLPCCHPHPGSAQSALRGTTVGVSQDQKPWARPSAKMCTLGTCCLLLTHPAVPASCCCTYTYIRSTAGQEPTAHRGIDAPTVGASPLVCTQSAMSCLPQPTPAAVHSAAHSQQPATEFSDMAATAALHIMHAARCALPSAWFRLQQLRRAQLQYRMHLLHSSSHHHHTSCCGAPSDEH
jgi:hypothetical protein